MGVNDICSIISNLGLYLLTKITKQKYGIKSRSVIVDTVLSDPPLLLSAWLE
jgi:hypothetical protein